MSEATTAGTVVFTDLVGFTEYNDACGDDAAVEVLDRVRRVADGAVAPVDGARVVKELGDGLLLWFPVACEAATRMAGFVSSIAEQRAEGGFPLAVRVGMHAGDARLRGDDIVGQTVNVAARIVDLAGPMEIVVSEAFVAACGRSADLPAVEAIGPTSVKGVSEPLWLYRVVVPATDFEGLRERR